MRSMALVLSVLLVGAIAWMSSARKSSDQLVPPESRVERSQPTQAPIELTAVSSESRERSPATTVAPIPSTAHSSVQGSQRCHVFGRVVDDQHVGVSGMVVRLHAFPPDGIAPPAKAVRTSWRTTTGADGVFSFDAQIALPMIATVHVRGSEWYPAVLRELGERPSSDAPALVAGENALGDIVLETDGAVSGRLVTTSGEPIRGANVRVQAAGSRNGHHTISSDLEGNFVVGCIPAGSARLEVLVNQVPRMNIADVRIARAETNQLGDIVVPDLPQVRGIVVDEAGAPVSGVVLCGSAHAKQSYTLQATTQADGTFTFETPQPEPLVIAVRSAPDFEPWNADESARMFDPGARDVRIVLVHATKTTFHVLDATTREPMESFGIRLTHVPPLQEEWETAHKSIVVGHHPDGLVTLPATSRMFTVVVTAPGHAPFEGIVAHDPGSNSSQTIVLGAASRLIGKLASSDTSFLDVKLRLEREWLARGDPFNTAGRQYDLGEHAGRQQYEAARDDGSFAFEDLVAGAYQLRIEGEGVARTILHDLHLPQEGTLDVGRIVVARAAVARVRVLTTQPDSPKGMSLWMDHDVERLTTVDKDEGIVEFKDLEPGPHFLQWSMFGAFDPPERDPEIQRFDLAAGESREIVVDARSPAPCTVVLHVTRNGKPVAGVGLAAWSRDPKHDRNRGFGPVESDSTGSVTGTVAGGSTCDLSAWAGKKCALAMIEDVAMPVGGRVERTLELHTGTLVVELPAEIDVPENGVVSVFMKRGPDDYTILVAHTPHSNSLPRGGLVWKSHVVDCGEIAAGEFDAIVRVSRFEPDSTRPNQSNEVALRPELTTKLRIEEDHEARIVVP